MKKVLTLLGSRNTKGNTQKLIKTVTSKLDQDVFGIEDLNLTSFNIKTCSGCLDCFVKTRCSISDDLELLQHKILDADVFIIASPVYLHYFTGDLKRILDRFAWWAHTLQLQGKPVVVLSTCSANGYTTVLRPLSDIMTYMGGNVIAAANAAQIPNQIENPEWLEEISVEISSRISKFVDLPPQSNAIIEKVFTTTKFSMLQQEAYSKESGLEFGESKIWRESGMLDFDSFQNYLDSKQ